MNVSEFDFDLPDDLIAQQPPALRGGSRLMVVDRASGSIAHRSFAELPSLLAAGRCAGRQRHARLSGAPDWDAAAGRRRRRVLPDSPGRRSRHLDRARASRTAATRRLADGFQASATGATGARVRRCMRRSSAAIFTGVAPCGCGPRTARPVRETIDAIGHVPLPPYIKRGDAIARSRSLSDRLRARTRIDCGADGRIALHAGDPARSSRHGASSASASRCTSATARSSRSASTASRSTRWKRSTTRCQKPRRRRLSKAKQEDRRVIAVGTTTTRTLESLTALERRRRHRPAPARRRCSSRPGHEFKLVSGLDHQLSPAAVVAADAGVGVWRPANEFSRRTGKRWRSAIGSIVMATRW